MNSGLHPYVVTQFSRVTSSVCLTMKLEIAFAEKTRCLFFFDSFPFLLFYRLLYLVKVNLYPLPSTFGMPLPPLLGRDRRDTPG